MPSKRQPARRNSSFVGTARSSAMSRGSYEISNRLANHYNDVANSGREGNGAFMRRGDKNRLRTAARQISHDASLRGNDYRYGTREQVQAQHGARYRNIRRAFGMSAG